MVEKEKTLKHIEERKKRKRSSEEDTGGSNTTNVEERPMDKKAKRHFKQIKPIEDLVKDKTRVSQSLVKSVFAKKKSSKENSEL